MNVVIAGTPARVTRHPQARRIKLAVDPATRGLRLSLPPRASLARALAWAEQQQGWIAAQLGRLTDRVELRDGSVVQLGDDALTILHDSTRRRGCIREGDRLVVGGPPDRLAASVTRWLKREALAVLSAESAEFAARAGVSVRRVAIGDTRSRWGSCGADGSIRYCWRLIMAPVQVRRATVAHEIAHRLHMDHSPAFHAAVARISDDPASAALSRDWLRAHGASLHAIG